MPIRRCTKEDHPALISLSLRAWAPVFSSLADVLGPEIFPRLHPDWQADQRRAVEVALGSDALESWVAEEDAAVVGFVAISVDHDRLLGEVYMIAVDPDAQRRGVGVALTEFALDELTRAGMRVAMIETGGDPGHAPARRTYERAGLVPLPVVRYFKAL